MYTIYMYINGWKRPLHTTNSLKEAKDWLEKKKITESSPGTIDNTWEDAFIEEGQQLDPIH